MPKGIYTVPTPKNESVKSYAPGSIEKAALKKELHRMLSQEVDVPMYIGGEQIRTSNKKRMAPPHRHGHTLGHFHYGDALHVSQAIQAALNAKQDWAALPWEHRASIFLKAAELLAGDYRAKINAATMLGQSKNVYQAEIDAACEFIDFLNFNVHYMTQIYAEQPGSSPGVWNRLEYRPLEGFVFAVTPFNFTSIAGNLAIAPALMGNAVVWKPADTQVYSAQVIMEVLKEAGLPDGVINVIYVDGPVAGDVIFKHKDFAGLHFTGSTGVFQRLWRTIGENVNQYKTYPRVVGETGGKDFIFAHTSADSKALTAAIIRGAFEFQGQKCSAASRVYLPQSLWQDVKPQLLAAHKTLTLGSPEDFTHFCNAVIDERAFDKIAAYIDRAHAAENVEVLAGGGHDKSEGYFIQPTIIFAQDPMYETMCEEIFGPVVTIYVYQDDRLEETLELVDQTSAYALTGAIFSQCRYTIERVGKKLVNAAGNFYINDKPTGAVVGQQPFGGARASGTNDKAGAALNLLRWVSPRTIKEVFASPKDYRYPFMDEA